MTSAERSPYEIILAPDAQDHLAGFEAGERAALLDAMEEQLACEPGAQTRNRKRMRPNALAPWELRVQRLRVYYEVDEAAHEVHILAIGVKDRERVIIAGEALWL